MYVLDLQELSIINSIPTAYNYSSREEIVFVATRILKDPRFDEKVAHVVIDKMIKLGYLAKTPKNGKGCVAVTYEGFEEYRRTVELLRKLVHSIF